MLKDTNQKFWQMGAIQSASLGLQGMLIGEVIATRFGVGAALTSLIIGNLVLWIIGLSMFSMTYREKGHAKHAIENVLTYFSKPITFIAAIVLMLAFISWFPIQIYSQSDFTNSILKNYPGWNSTASTISTIIFSMVIIGSSTLGIRAIKWICTICFPLLLLYVLLSLFKQSGPAIPITWGISRIPAKSRFIFLPNW